MMTLLEQACRSSQQAPRDDALRLRLYERLADAEVFLLLEEEPVTDQIKPRLLKLEDRDYALLFDSERHMAEFVDQATPYLALSGRQLAQLLRGQGIGLGLNLGVSDWATLLPATVVDWLVETLSHKPHQTEVQPEFLSAPRDLPETLLRGIDVKLASMAGLATTAYLAAIRYSDGGNGHLLAFINALPNAQTAMAAAISEAVQFSAEADNQLDVAFFSADDPICPRLAAVALRYDLPEAKIPDQAIRPAPGSDPLSPPKLR